MIDDKTLDSTMTDEDDDEMEVESGDAAADEMSGEDLAAQALSSVEAMPASPQKSAAVGETLTALQNVIERNADELDRITEEMKQHREKLQNLMENDTELSEATEQVKQFSNKVKERRAKILNSPEVIQEKASITELNERKKDIQEALNNHLLNLYQMTGTKTVDTTSGQREFSVRAALKSKKAAA